MDRDKQTRKWAFVGLIALLLVVLAFLSLGYVLSLLARETTRYEQRAERHTAWLNALQKEEPELLEDIKHDFCSQGRILLIGTVKTERDWQSLHQYANDRFGAEQAVIVTINVKVKQSTDVDTRDPGGD